MTYDPRHYVGALLPIPRPTLFKVEGYNSNGSRHVYPPRESLEEAQREAARYLRRGDRKGKKWEHYAILEIQRSLHMSLLVHEVSSPEVEAIG